MEARRARSWHVPVSRIHGQHHTRARVRTHAQLRNEATTHDFCATNVSRNENHIAPRTKIKGGAATRVLGHCKEAKRG